MKTETSTTDDLPRSFQDLSPEQARSIDELCDYFEHQLYTQGQPKIESLLGGFREPERSILLHELLWLELEACRAQGAVPSESAYCRRFAEHEALVREIFAAIFPAETASVFPQPRAPEVSNDWPSIPHYRILRELSHGGMGTVYEAIHTRLGSRVAVKVLREKLAGSVEAEAGFEREMKVIGTLNHPHLVAARDAGTFEGQHYLVMEYVEGLDLGDVLNRLRTLTVGDACEIPRSAAWGLQHAHQHRLVHRDIKPKNIMLGRSADGDALVKVADFGLASLLGYAALRDPHIPYARIAGTFAFMAPEQYWEKSADIRSDIYGLGCTLYCLLMGKPPFPPSSYHERADLMEAHRSQPVPDIRRLRPDVPEPLETILLRMLAKSPADRYESPSALAHALVPFAEDHDLSGLLDRAEATPPREFALPGPFGRAPVPLASHRETSRRSSQNQDDTISWNAAAEVAAEPEQAVPPPPAPVPAADIAPSQAAPAGWRIRIGPLLPALPRTRVRVFGAVVLGALIVAAILVIARSMPPASVDLLAHIDPGRDAIQGRWQSDNGDLVSPDSAQALLQIAYPLPEQYRLEVHAERLSGWQRLLIGLNWEGRKIPVVLDGIVVESKRTGDGQAMPDARREIPDAFDYRGPANCYVVIVRREGIVVAWENRVLFQCWPDAMPETAATDWNTAAWHGAYLVVGTHLSQYRFRRIMLTPLVR